MIREFIVPGQPVAKARARAGRHGFYTPKNTVDAENRIAFCYRSAYVGVPLIDSAICLTCNFYFEMPKSWSQKKKQEYNTTPHTQKPDADNLLKTVKDGLNKIAWVDDSLVWSVYATKIWTNEKPFTAITISYSED